MNARSEMSFELEGVRRHYKGKVRELLEMENGWLFLVASDRLSAFDVIMPRGIPHKGQVLNQLAQYFLEATSDIVPNWWKASPDPNVAAGVLADPFKVEMVIRGHLSGHAWRTYSSGKRVLCGVQLPEGMKEHDPFPEPIITPSTKAEQGDHDEDISREDILSKGIVEEKDYLLLEESTRLLFGKGQEMANERGLILVDTKYEFGKTASGEIVLIDEVHTPDSSRYFYLEGFDERQEKGEAQEQLSKEFVREWLIANDFQGKEGQTIPEMTDEIINDVSERYISLYQRLTGKEFIPAETHDVSTRINKALKLFLNNNPKP